MGAGKGYLLKLMEKQGYFPTSQFVKVDPDAIRMTLPEWDGYVKRDAGTAGMQTQKEAGMLAEILQARGLYNRRNVLIDGSLRAADWYAEHISTLRKNYPGIRIAIIHVTCAEETVLARAASRAKKTGRVVPEDILKASMKQVPESVKKLSPLVDCTFRIDTSKDGDPQLSPPLEPVSTSIAPENLTWEYVSKLWWPETVDKDGDGVLSKEEVAAGVASGVFSEMTVASMDADADGDIDQADVAKAAEAARAISD